MHVRRLLLIPLVALAIAACDGEPSAALTRPLPIDATAQDVLDGARDAMADVTSYVWTSDVEFALDESRHRSRAHVEGFWMAPDDYQFTTTWDTEGRTTVIEHRWVDGRAFQRLDGEWQTSPNREPMGVPRYDGRSEVPPLENVDFPLSLTSAVQYQIGGDSIFDLPELGDLSPITAAVQLSVSHLDLLVTSVASENHYADGSGWSQTTIFSRFNVNGTIDLPPGFESDSDPEAP
jgi:hypothetical protein